MVVVYVFDPQMLMFLCLSLCQSLQNMRS